MTDKVQIDIFGPTSRISGPFPKAAIRIATSYPVEGAQFAKSYRSGVWDGRKHLFRSTSNTFPTGLVNTVKETCELAGQEVEIVDHRAISTPQGGSYALTGVKMEGKYSYQLDAAKKAVEARQGILRIATNGGKCLHPDTKIRMFDGTVKTAGTVQVGDKLMGPDNTPRTVKSTCIGIGPMYKIIPRRGNSWICNDVHVLTLQHTVTNEILDIPLNYYLRQTAYFKHCYKQFSVGVDYPEQQLDVDPYFVGLWLGDGTKRLKTVAVTTADCEIVDYLESVAQDNGGYLYEDDHPDNASSTYHMSVKKVNGPNRLLTLMRELFDSENIRIPQKYLTSSVDQRKKLLSGLIDSDGHLHENRFYEIVQVRKGLAEDVYELARSLGFGATITPKVVNGVTYWRVNILGVDKDSLPFIRLARKQITSRRQKHPNRTAFSVEALGDGDYAGFTLDGDGRFLLADYTVTHNTEIACAVTQYLKLPTLFMVTTRELLYQARERFMKRLSATEEEVGIIGDGHWEPGTWVTVATVDTLESRIDKTECQEFLKTVKVLFADECHHLGSETWFEICTLCPADYRYGLSGTPMDRTDGANLRLLGAIGDIIVDIPNKFLVEQGISARTSIIFSKVTAPVLPKKTPYATAYKQGIVDNPNALSLVVDWVKVFAAQGLGTLVLCEEIAHGKAIDEALWTATDGVFIPHQFIYGDESTEVRRNTLKDFAEGRLPVLIASTILDEGVDVPTIDALILAGSRKSRIKTMQRLGRGLRGNKLIAVEFANFCHDHLLRHSLQRYEDYKKENCFPLYQSGPDAELVKKIWHAESR